MTALFQPLLTPDESELFCQICHEDIKPLEEPLKYQESRVGDCWKIYHPNCFSPEDRNSNSFHSMPVTELTCAICSNDLKPPESPLVFHKVEEIWHIFHAECIAKWLVTKKDAGCPLCKRRIVRIAAC